MNTLNLTLINEQTPYEVWQTSQGDFNFETDFGVLYRMSIATSITSRYLKSLRKKWRTTPQ